MKATISNATTLPRQIVSNKWEEIRYAQYSNKNEQGESTIPAALQLWRESCKMMLSSQRQS